LCKFTKEGDKEVYPSLGNSFRGGEHRGLSKTVNRINGRRVIGRIRSNREGDLRKVDTITLKLPDSGLIDLI
jgi:hypothetical protein